MTKTRSDKKNVHSWICRDSERVMDELTDRRPPLEKSPSRSFLTCFADWLLACEVGPDIGDGRSCCCDEGSGKEQPKVRG